MCPDEKCVPTRKIIMEHNSKIEVVNLAEVVLPTGLIRKIPAELIMKYQFIPISLQGNILTCAFGELPDSKVISYIEFSANYKIKVVLVARSEIQNRLNELFPVLEPIPETESQPKPISRLSNLQKKKRLVYSSSAKEIGRKNTKLFITIGSVIVILLALIISIKMFIGKGNNEDKKQEELKNLKNQNQQLITKINRISSEDITKIKSALKALKKLESGTKVGINFNEYSSRIIDTQSEIDSFESECNHVPSEIKEDIKKAMECYADADMFWNAKVNNLLDNDFDRYMNALHKLEKYTFLPKSIYSNQEILSPLWEKASEYIENASNLLKKLGK